MIFFAFFLVDFPDLFFATLFITFFLVKVLTSPKTVTLVVVVVEFSWVRVTILMSSSRQLQKIIRIVCVVFVSLRVSNNNPSKKEINKIFSHFSFFMFIFSDSANRKKFPL